MIVVVGGPQYRAGSHRQFVSLARSLASAGVATFRFDARGMGDGVGERRSFEELSQDIAAAIDLVVQRVPDARELILWGLCDGASAALLYCQARRDARVRGLCLVNPWVRSPVSLARTHIKHYYARRLLERSFWAKLGRGRVARDAWRELLRNLAQARTPKGRRPPTTFQDRMALAWHDFTGPILLLLSGSDYTAREFLEYLSSSTAWSQALAHPRLERRDIADADHTFSDARSRRQMEKSTLGWLERSFPGIQPARSVAMLE